MIIKLVGICEGGFATMSVSNPSVALSCANRNRRRKIKPSSDCAKQQSSSSVPTDKLGHLAAADQYCNKKGSSSPAYFLKRSSTPNVLMRQENTVGIIGGVSVFSTLMFLEKLIWWSTKQNQTCVPFILCSDPTVLKHEVRSSSPVNGDRGSSQPHHGHSHSLMVENLRKKTEYLEESGARCLVMPCHVSHAWYNEISEGRSLHFLHVGECVAQELKEANLKPLETGYDVKIGVIADEQTLMAGFYQEKIQNQGFEVVLPDKETMEHILKPAIKALSAKDVEGARNLLRVAVQVLLVKAVNLVIIASDELQGLLPRNDPLARKCIDPMDALARSTVKWVQSVKTN